MLYGPGLSTLDTLTPSLSIVFALELHVFVASHKQFKEGSGRQKPPVLGCGV